MSARRTAYWLATGLGFAFLVYLTVVRRTDDGVPLWAMVAAPVVVVGLIAYDVWYRRTRSPRSDRSDLRAAPPGAEGLRGS